MATPWTPPQQTPAERSWRGMAVLVTVPLLSLILIRMLWSGSSLWFLTVGIILLGAAAVFFLSRRPPETVSGHQTLAQEPSRAPLILTGLGVLFLAMLLLPNFADGDSRPDRTAQQQPQSPIAPLSEVSGVQEPPAQQAPVQQPAQDLPAQEPPAQQAPVEEQIQPPAEDAAPVEGQLYVVQDGDNLWDIAQRFSTPVDAIVAANELEDPEELELGQELLIPESEEAVETADSFQ